MLRIDHLELSCSVVEEFGNNAFLHGIGNDEYTPPIGRIPQDMRIGIMATNLVFRLLEGNPVWVQEKLEIRSIYCN